MAAMAMQRDGGLTLPSPIASLPPTTFFYFARRLHLHPHQFERTMPKTCCFRSFERAGFGAHHAAKKSDAGKLLKTGAADWRSSFFEDEVVAAMSSEALKVNPSPQNPSLGFEGHLDCVEDHADSVVGQASELLNGADVSHVAPWGNGIEVQRYVDLNEKSNGAVEAWVGDDEEKNGGAEQHSVDSGGESASKGGSQSSLVQMDRCKQVVGLFKEQKIEEALGLLSDISELDEWALTAYLELLRDCAKAKDAATSKELHALALKHGFMANMVLSSNFVSTFCKLGMVPEAQKVFDSMPDQTPLSWNALVSGYAKHGYHEEAVKLYERMKAKGFEPNAVTFISMLGSCAKSGDIELGRKVHADAARYDFEYKPWVSTSLLNMYVKCGIVEEAQQVFDKMPNRNVMSWTAMISAYAKGGKGREALNLYQQMKRAGLKPTYVTFVFVLKACASLGNLEQGQQIHADIMRSGIVMNVYMGTALIDMYSKCGSVEKALMVFERIPSPNGFCFATLVLGLSRNKKYEEAVRYFEQMKQQGFKPNEMTTAFALHSCGNAGLLEEGIQIHNYVVKDGLILKPEVVAGLIDMYSRCGRLQLAREVFEKIDQQSVVVWTAMIAAYARNAAGEDALKLFDQMKDEGMKPDGMTFVFALLACAGTTNLERGKQVHAEILEAGLESDVSVGSALVDMYSKCGSLDDSRLVFDRMPKKNIITWTSMITGYLRLKNADEAFQLYRKMKLDGMKPDTWVFACVLNACAQMRSLEYGEEVHEDINKSQYANDAGIQKALMIMYSKCRSPHTPQEQEQEILWEKA